MEEVRQTLLLGSLAASGTAFPGRWVKVYISGGVDQMYWTQKVSGTNQPYGESRVRWWGTRKSKVGCGTTQLQYGDMGVAKTMSENAVRTLNGPYGRMSLDTDMDALKQKMRLLIVFPNM